MQIIQATVVLFFISAVTLSHASPKNNLSVKNSKTTINTTINAKSKKSFTLPGKNIREIKIKKRAGNKLNFTIKLGHSILEKGTTNQTIRIKSDGRSNYQLILSNPTNKPQKQVLSITKTGGGNDI